MNNLIFFNTNNPNLITKKIYLFGNGDIAAKTISKIRFKFKILGIFDNKKTLWGIKTKDGLSILSPNFIKKIKKNSFHIIITTSSYNDVSKQLKSFGLKPNKDFSVTYLLQDQSTIDEIQNYECKLSFTSGTFKKNKKNAGGGIYNLTLNKNNWKIEKKVSGSCYSIIENNNHYYFTHSEKGLVKSNKSFKILKVFNLNSSLRAHGISYSKKYKSFFVACANADKILMINENLTKITNEFSISNKKNEDEISRHHCNDCFVKDDSLFVSVFSISGNYKYDAYDGGIIEIDLNTGEKISVVKDNLIMPHNVMLINDKFHVLDSLKGNLLTNNFSIQGTFPGFSRGLDFDGKYYFIGQSRNRQFSKHRNIMNNVSSDTGIIIFDNVNKVSRFLNLDNEISEVHQILIHK
jgi:hypothetical protein